MCEPVTHNTINIVINEYLFNIITCNLIVLAFHGPLIIFRRKREVATVLVERGVAERVRLSQLYEQKRNELQKQHDLIRQQLLDHKKQVYITTLILCNY